MNRFLWTIALLSLLTPGAAVSQTEAEAEPVQRPGDESGTAAQSDGMAECAAIMAAASPTATNLIDRRNMKMNADAWLATAGTIAAEEGSGQIGPDVWDTKVTEWSQRIGDLDAMRAQTDWMAYCADVASTHGLDGTAFAVSTQ